MVKALPFYLLTFTPLGAGAQTFTERVQQNKEGEGSVSIHQDKAIDDLVNGAAKPEKPAVPVTPATPAVPRKQEKPQGDTAQQPAQPADTLAAGTHRRTYKTTGYRVQAYAGGNTRRDRQKAESIGNTLRRLYPEEEVYVHFYNPRWICRIGNYRTYEEAHARMLEIRKLGYDAATVVKGKITVTR